MAWHKFETDKQYLASAVTARVQEMPGVGKFRRAIKIKLRISHSGKDNKLSQTEQLEAVIWLVVPYQDEKSKESTFLQDAGIRLDGSKVHLLPGQRPELVCCFGEREGDEEYQPLKDYTPKNTVRLVSDLISDCRRTPTGLKPDRFKLTVSRGSMKPVQLTRIEFKLFLVLDAAHRAHVSLGQLRTAVSGWNPLTDRHTIGQTVYVLRRKLKRIGFTISKKLGDEGWALMRIDKN